MPKVYNLSLGSPYFISRLILLDRLKRALSCSLIKSLGLTLVISTMLFSCEQQPYGQGENLYQAYCASCHMKEGQGLKSLIPPLAQSDYLTLNREQLACIIRYGLENPIIVNGKRFEQPMAGIDQLNAVEITNILNFVGSSWGNNLDSFTLEEVEVALEACAPD